MKHSQFKYSWIFIDGSTRAISVKQPSARIAHLAFLEGILYAGASHVNDAEYKKSSDYSELLALLYTLRGAKNLHSPVLIVTDSAYVYKSIANRYIEEFKAAADPILGCGGS
uniref:RNase H domain-containing protein n=1 Tax=Rhabditophanes sp. KR3021 TaxID=114890 RepID=A0AC35TJD2_9BILA